MALEYVQIPPDSTGKRVRHKEILDITLTNVQVSVSEISEGATITGQNSNATGRYVGGHTQFGQSFIHLVEVQGNFSIGETIESNENGAVGDIQTLQETYTPQVSIIDQNRPSRFQDIDDAGSAFVRFREGDMEFNAFGAALFSENRVIDQHLFTLFDNAERYYTVTQSGASVGITVNDSTLTFQTPTTSGSIARRTSNVYYPYTAGQGTQTMLSVLVGDTGKSNVVRRWGMFDENDGLYFELSGSEFNVCVRNSSGGSVTTKKAEQSTWNGDQLDDPDVSEYVLDVSKFNNYWIDYQWLGAGRVRFGTYAPDGTRVVAHTFFNANTNVLPFMKTGTLPLRLEQENLDTAGSTSEMKLICASVIRQNTKDEYIGDDFTAISDRITVTGSNYTPIMSFKPVSTVNGEYNRISFFAKEISLDVSGSSCQLAVTLNGALTGSTFNSPTQSYSATTIDKDATNIQGGEVVDYYLFGKGHEQRMIAENIRNSLQLRADGAAPTYTLAVKPNDPSGSADVTAAVRWKEVL